ncbi:MAG: SpoIID/LytB domain-containing protein [Muribaculaceae bacterium]|nr:SpoIID/LytB domain-containing protein [Muribaculaceae bacterium]
MSEAEKVIRVGLLTDGLPQAEACVRNGMSGFMIQNLLIGYGFHWRKTITAFVPGELELLESSRPPIQSVMTVPLEAYVLSVISSEMNPSAPLEFLKAHAVISRSWAMRKILGDSHKSESGRVDEAALHIGWEEADSHVGFDVCSDDHCQRFQGLPEVIPSSALKAVEATRGLVIKDREGQIADARFSKCCGGRTEIFSSCWADKDYDYLVSKEDSWCNLSDMTESSRNEFLSAALKNYDAATQDFYQWSRRVGRQWLRDRVKSRYGIDVGTVKTLEVSRRGPSGRAVRIIISGADGSVEIGKELAIRRLLTDDCLYSSRFDIMDEREGFLLEGRGWGHGVGLCQIGAARMAFEGRQFREILDFYYPGTNLELL